MSKPWDTETFNKILKLKLNELQSVFNTQTEILTRNEDAHAKAMDDLKTQMEEKEETQLETHNLKIQLHQKDLLIKGLNAENEKLKTKIAEKVAEIAELNEIINKSNEEISNLNESFKEKSRHASETSNRLNHSERRIENMRIELASYLTKLAEIKKKYHESEMELACSQEMQNRVSKMLQKSFEDYMEMNSTFEHRCQLQDEHIKTLVETLELHGIYDLEEDTVLEELQPDVVEEELESEEIFTRPPLRNYPNWRLPSQLTTILEVDETEEDYEDEEEEVEDEEER